MRERGRMRYRIAAGVVGAALLAGGFMISLALATPSTKGRVPAGRAMARGLDKIDHIVFIIKENHSFDNYFGRFPGADGAATGRTSTGAVVPLAEAPDQVYPDIGHSAKAADLAYDDGRMDYFDRIAGAVTLGVDHSYVQMWPRD